MSFAYNLSHLSLGLGFHNIEKKTVVMYYKKTTHRRDFQTW